MRRTIHTFFVGLAGLSLAACHSGDEWSDEVPQSEGMPIAVHTRVVAESMLNSGPSGRLLFWNNNVFHGAWMQCNPEAEPNFTVLLDKEINHYTYERHVYYETPYTYPSNFGKIHATGYAPDNVLTPVTSKGFTELDVKVRDGSVDLLSCDGCEAHSASMKKDNESDNTFLQERKELKFRHLTAKLTFLGERTPDMVGMVGVRNIRIAFIKPTDEKDGLVIPTRLKLHTRDSDVDTRDYTTYIVSETIPYPYAHKVLEHKPIIPPNEAVTLGTCYVLSKGIVYGEASGQFDPIKGEWVGTHLNAQPKLGIQVRAELYDAQSGGDTGAYTEETWTLDPIDKWSTHTGDKFLPGYEYKVTITFNRTGVALRAEAVPWNSEELHEYPIHPVPSGSEAEVTEKERRR
ncbi:hypothetical protein HMPREF1069_05018 [Bacteroides ovatus CL02T12C04]|jgi:lipoprotein|nr:hypothetical protein HMPREF1069_05018 [Bacteroides ovatus CL02T12C04]